MSDESNNNQNQGIDWSPEKIEVLLKNILPLTDRYLNYKDTKAKHESKFVESTANHDRKVISSFDIFEVYHGALIWLTWTEKIDGASLLFAVGLTIGYVFEGWA